MPGSDKKAKAVKAEVKKEVKKAVEAKVHPKQKKQHWKKEKKEIKKEVKKEVKKENQGPKVQFKVKVTAALGYVTGEKDHGPSLKLNVFLHPSLCKSPDEQSAFGPLQAAAAQYGLWRCTKAHIRFTPLVGPSAVSGTVIRASANLTQTPSSTSWGGLGARKHRDMQAGKSGTFILNRRDLAGPRDGGWWLTDTNNEGAQAAGPIVECHALGQTMSTYQDKAWTSELFIVELTGEWEFANYTMNPAMGNLERHDGDAAMIVSTDQDGKLQLEVAEGSTMARFMDDPTVRNSKTGTGEVIFQVVDTAASAITSLVPPPFNWLLKGGWWFVKKLAGVSRAGNARYQIYASLTDAQNGRPVITSVASQTGKQVTGPLQVTQINAPNLGGGQSQATVRSGPNIFPLPPSTAPSLPSSDNILFKAIVSRVHAVEETPNVPPPFVRDILSFGGRRVSAVVYAIRQPLAAGYERSSSNLQAWSTNFDSHSTGGVPFLINSECVTGNDDIKLFLSMWHSTAVANSCYLNVLVGTNPLADVSFGHVTRESFYLYESRINHKWQLDATNLTAKRILCKVNTKIRDADWMFIFISSTKWDPSKTDYNAAVLPSDTEGKYHPQQLGLVTTGGLTSSETFTGDFNIWAQPKTLLTVVAEKLGIGEEDISTLFQDASDRLPQNEEESSDADDQSNDEDAETEEEDDDEDDASFERIPEPSKTDNYLLLRNSGLTHKEALEVLTSGPDSASSQAH